MRRLIFSILMTLATILAVLISESHAAVPGQIRRREADSRIEDRNRDRLTCSYDGTYLKVSDGINKYEKFIGGNDSAAQVDCGRERVIALIGPYIVQFFKGNFSDRFVGNYPSRLLDVKGDMAAAVVGPYFFVIKAGRIIEKFIGSQNDVELSVSQELVLATMGPYILASRGDSIQDKFVGGSGPRQIATTMDSGAVLTTSYLVAYVGNSFIDKFIGSSDKQDMEARSGLIAAASGPYFLVVDIDRRVIRDKFTGGTGKVSVERNRATFHPDNGGRVVNYDLLSGLFD